MKLMEPFFCIIADFAGFCQKSEKSGDSPNPPKKNRGSAKTLSTQGFQAISPPWVTA
jgi:hypothetical protein